MADTTGQLSAKAYSMRERIDTFRRSVAQMKKLVSQVIKHNAAIKKKQEDFAKRFDALSTDEFYRPLEMSFRALGEATRKVEDARDKKLCARLGVEPGGLMDTLDLYNKREMKNLQAYIADRDKAIKVMGKSSRKLYGTSGRSPSQSLTPTPTPTPTPGLRSKLERKHLENSAIAHDTENLFVANMESVEERRIEDLRHVLIEYIRSHLAFHCAAIEEYTRVGQLIYQLNPVHAQEELGELLANNPVSIRSATGASSFSPSPQHLSASAAAAAAPAEARQSALLDQSRLQQQWQSDAAQQQHVRRQDQRRSSRSTAETEEELFPDEESPRDRHANHRGHREQSQQRLPRNDYGRHPTTHHHHHHGRGDVLRAPGSEGEGRRQYM